MKNAIFLTWSEKTSILAVLKVGQIWVSIFSPNYCFNMVIPTWSKDLTGSCLSYRYQEKCFFFLTWSEKTSILAILKVAQILGSIFSLNYCFHMVIPTWSKGLTGSCLSYRYQEKCLFSYLVWANIYSSSFKSCTNLGINFQSELLL